MNGGILIVNMDGITQLHLIDSGIMAVYVRGSFQRIMVQGGIEYVHALSCENLQQIDGAHDASVVCDATVNCY